MPPGLPRLVVVSRCCLVADLEDSEVVIRAIEAYIPVRPLDSVSIATDIQCREPADAHWAQPTGKGVGFDTFRVVAPAHRADEISPRLVVQLLFAENVIALTHHRLRGWRRRGAALADAA
jgi:hypothetical protein